MRKIGIIATCLLSIVALSAKSSVISKEINYGWQFKEARLNNWYNAKVPGVVHLDLISNKIIEDPFFRLNERAVQWVDKEDWVYETELKDVDSIWSCNNQRLRFMGLDTYADAYLNDKLILKADNMFREWNVDVKGILKSDKNILKVYFHSPIKVDLPKWEKLPYHLKANNDQSQNGGMLDRQVSIFARKAGYHYGWDWGPRLVTSGIWRTIYLQGWNDAKIENVQYVQQSVTKSKAKLQTIVQVLSDKNMTDADIVIKADGKIVARQTSDLKEGLNSVAVDYSINNPHLWWTNGLGESYLYTFETSVSKGKQVLDASKNKIGIRSLKLITKKDKFGTSFGFELNGVPVFMKGANYIPCDNFLPRVTYKDYEKTLLAAKDANMNMLRVWGGGIYENDEFYDLCDKYGILIWQDFMFACSLYPADDAFLANVRQEAVDNVKRLRNHSCIALWCGNNENQDAWFGWGWKAYYEKLNQQYADTIWKQFQNQYFKMLPEVVAEYGGGISYRPSSPFSFKDGGSDGKNGDSHFWGIWHGNKPIDDYNTTRGRFFSEYGFQSFPEYESVKRYAPEERDHNIYSEVMMAHQRGGEFANKRIEEYMLKEFKKPRDFEQFLYVGMVLQGDAIKTAMEAHRRNMPYCMGSLFWQHNDCWPVASWSSRDYYGRWKAQHYYARKAYENILVSPYIRKDSVTVTLVSDYLQNEDGELNVKAMTLDGKILYDYKQHVTVKANSSELMFNKPLSALLKNEAKENVIIYTSFKCDKGTFDNIGYAAKQKDMNYPKQVINRSIKQVKDGFEVTLTASQFARAVFMSIDGIDNFFGDNYFDLLPGQERTIMVQSSLSLNDFDKQLKVESLSDSY